MVRAPTPPRGQWRDAALRCSSFLLVMASAGLLGSCGGGGGGGGGDVGRSSAPPSGSTPPAGTTGAVTLAWDPTLNPNLAGYRIYYGTSAGTYSQPLGSGLNAAGNVTGITVTGLTSGTRYYFSATAYDSGGNETAFSNEVFADVP